MASVREEPVPLSAPLAHTLLTLAFPLPLAHASAAGLVPLYLMMQAPVSTVQLALTVAVGGQQSAMAFVLQGATPQAWVGPPMTPAPAALLGHTLQVLVLPTAVFVPQEHTLMCWEP